MGKLFKVGGVLLIIWLIILFFKKNSPENQNTIESATPAYVNVAVKISDITLKLIYEFSSMEKCQQIVNDDKKSNIIADFEKMCSGSTECKSVNISACSTSIDSKYIKMLNKNYSGSQYLHLTDSRNTQERTVIAFWELTNDEAEKVCNYIKSRKS